MLQSRRMFILEVLPISRGLRKGSLTYTSRQPVSVGSTVIVPIRGSELPAVVIRRTPVAAAKGDIKAAAFSLKPIISNSSSLLADTSFIHAAIETGSDHLTTPARILEKLLPSWHLKNILADQSDLVFSSATDSTEKTNSTRPDETLLHLPWEERMQYYRTYVRRLFSEGKSLAIVAPTRATLKRLQNEFSTISPEHCHTLSGKTSAKKAAEILAIVHQVDRPVVLLLTPLYLYSLPPNTHTLIIESSADQNYQHNQGLQFDIRTFIHHYARLAKLKLIYAGSLTALPIFKRWHEHEISSEAEPIFRLPLPPNTQLVDIQKLAATAEGAGSRQPLLDESIFKAIDQARIEGGRVFIFAPRTGEAPLTICHDCRTILRCPRCHHVITRHLDPARSRYAYRCHHCATSFSPDHTCGQCGGHSFWYQGIGTETLSELIRKHYREVEPIILDGVHTKTDSQLRSALEQFTTTPSSIAIGTVRALPLLPKLHTTIIASLDSLAVHPDPNVYQEIMGLISTLAEKTSHTFLVQGRIIPQSVSALLRNGSLLPWYENELQVRAKLHQPPYAIKLQFSCSGNPGDSEKHMQYLAKFFGEKSVGIIWGEKPTEHNLSVTILPHIWNEFRQSGDHSRLGKLLHTLRNYYQITRPDGTLASLS